MLLHVRPCCGVVLLLVAPLHRRRQAAKWRQAVLPHLLLLVGLPLAVRRQPSRRHAVLPQLLIALTVQVRRVISNLGAASAGRELQRRRRRNGDAAKQRQRPVAQEVRLRHGPLHQAKRLGWVRQLLLLRLAMGLWLRQWRLARLWQLHRTMHDCRRLKAKKSFGRSHL